MAKSKINDVLALRDRFARAFDFTIEPAHTATEHYYKRSDTGEVAASVSTKLGFTAKPWLSKWKVRKALDHLLEHEKDIELFGLPHLINDAKDAADKIRDEAAGFGTNAHEAIDRYVTRWITDGVAPEPVPGNFLGEGSASEEIAAFRSFARFISEYEIIPIASEQRLWYGKGKDRYAGTVDIVFLYLQVRKGRTGSGEGGTCISGYHHEYVPQDSGTLWCVGCGRDCDVTLILGDHKTSNSIKDKDDYALQGEGYARALEQVVGITFNDVWVMRYSKKEAEYEICKVKDRKQAWKEFISISRAYDAKASREQNTGLLAPLQEKEVIRI